ncbi:hypothetical protein [Azospirillum sp. B510]|uniref:hypothetical protein n=1 Tax=Azospirillum sp. (strain B510) TaxID=137722 RepID=UPI00031EA786|nr:hypothetical protein [Azospirillum sp. B510]
MPVAFSRFQVLQQGILHLCNGQPSGIPFNVRFLDADDLPALEAFRAVIFGSLPDIDAYFPETPDFAGLHMAERGVTLGLETHAAPGGGRLIGCAVLGLPQPGMPAFADDLPGGGPAVTATAHMSSCMVHTDFRGNGLQRLLVTMRTLYALGAGRPHLLSRVALSNPVSLSNMLASGFTARRILVMHGGRLRYLLHRDMRAPPPSFEPATERALRIADHPAQNVAFEAGLVGHAVTFHGDEPFMIYARPAVPADLEAFP